MTAEESSTDLVPSSALTEEQQRFLDACEAEFANRYTDDDLEYVRERDAGPGTPPIVDPWYNKPRRNFDWSRQHGNSGKRQNWGNRDGGGRDGGGRDGGGRDGGGRDGGGRDAGGRDGGGYHHHRQTDRYQQRHRPY